MSAKRETFVTFLSPGTFVSEASTYPIDSRDLRLALAMAEKVTERYGAKPYGFRFEERIVGEMPDGQGGKLHASKDVGMSGIYFLGGKLETVDDVVARNDPKESVLRTNMQGNDMSIVIVNTNSYRSTLPFGEEDCIVDATGAVVERGDSPERIAYRAKKKADHEAELRALYPGIYDDTAVPSPSLEKP